MDHSDILCLLELVSVQNQWPVILEKCDCFLFPSAQSPRWSAVSLFGGYQGKGEQCTCVEVCEILPQGGDSGAGLLISLVWPQASRIASLGSVSCGPGLVSSIASGFWRSSILNPQTAPPGANCYFDSPWPNDFGEVREEVGVIWWQRPILSMY